MDNHSNEKDFLSDYNIEQYERPSLATDIVVFSFMNRFNDQNEIRNQDNFRKLPEKKWKVLLIKRGEYPFKDCWAIPGGFCKKGEDVIQTARRELFEETNVKHAYMSLTGVFGEKDRDPRGWIISNTYTALVDGEQARIKAGSDANEAKWFSIELQLMDSDRTERDSAISLSNKYKLTLTDEEGGLQINSLIEEQVLYEHFHETVSFAILENDALAFDHAKILLSSILNIRKELEHNDKLIFDLMPEYFSFAELQMAYEMITGKPQLVANFRRKMKDYCIETDKVKEGAGHRPAKLMMRDVTKFV